MPNRSPPRGQPFSWLLLIHQIPPKPAYLRVKIWRRLQRLGAVAIKNSVYALPANEQAREDFEWVLREIVEGGGDGSVVEAKLVEGLSDDGVKALFMSARDADYGHLADEARTLLESAQHVSRDNRDALLSGAERLKARLEEIAAIDFFDAPGRTTVEGILTSALARLEQARSEKHVDARQLARAHYREKVWVTRSGIHVDRMASAWLIRRFVDPHARLKFVDPKKYVHRKGELRFDMFGGEFTHEGSLCSFEVLVTRFGLDAPALRVIGEIVHDIDLKEARFSHPETAGVAAFVNGIAMSHENDTGRLEAAQVLFDALHALFTRKRRPDGQEKKP